MITIMILPNFKGTKKDFFVAGIICLLLDSTYLIPMIL
jgi:hypothetical protein